MQSSSRNVQSVSLVTCLPWNALFTFTVVLWPQYNVTNGFPFVAKHCDITLLFVSASLKNSVEKIIFNSYETIVDYLVTRSELSYWFTDGVFPEYFGNFSRPGKKYYFIQSTDWIHVRWEWNKHQKTWKTQKNSKFHLATDHIWWPCLISHHLVSHLGWQPLPEITKITLSLTESTYRLETKTKHY